MWMRSSTCRWPVNSDPRAPKASQFATDLVFLDIEASSLKAHSWPVEIGLSSVGPGGEIVTRSQLIRPKSSWSMTAWTAGAEAIHGISLDVLKRDGVPAEQVARWYVADTRGRRVVSDAPEFDARWLQHLLWPIRDSVDVEEICESVLSIEEGVWAWLSPAAQEAWLEELRHHSAPHRAGPDAERMARAYRAARLAT